MDIQIRTDMCAFYGVYIHALMLIYCPLILALVKDIQVHM